MDEYYINYQLFKNIIDRIDKTVDDKILYLLQQIIDKLYNMEQNEDDINDLIETLEKIFIQYFYDYNLNIDQYEIVEDIGIYPFDSQISILQIRLDNYIEKINKHIQNKDEWFINTNDELLMVDSYQQFMEHILKPLKEHLKIYRWLIMSSFLLLQELIEEMKNIDNDDLQSNLTPLRCIFEIREFLQNCKIKKRNIYQEELFL